MSTILVVDDEQRIRRVYRSLFESEGHNSNIVDAREQIKQTPIDLVLLDINMGEFSGDILYEIFLCFHRYIRVIVPSVYPLDEQQSIIPEAYDYFDKSEGNKVLLEKVRRALEHKNEWMNKNILVVDDDMRERRMFHYLLNKAGYDSTEFATNNILFDYLDKQNKNIDLLILCLATPKKIAVDLFKTIRKRYPDLKIMITSSFSLAEQKNSLPEAIDYFNKADGEEVLIEKIKQLT
ncbi:MAG: response regulator [Candidatus Omnitrophica bacterium]|nr:response regulator [Candidatus Omnitrophota bacterium]